MALIVYTAQYHGARNHVALFVRPSDTDAKTSGKCYHVTGTILAGMKSETRDCESPLVAADHVPDTMVLIGSIKVLDLARFEENCRSIPPPEAQLKLNGKPKDPSKRLRRCGAWVDEVIEKLKAEDVLLEVQKTPENAGTDM